MSREGRRRVEAGQPARRGNPSPALVLTERIQAPWSSRASSPSRGAAQTRISVDSGISLGVSASSLHAPESTTEGVRGLSRGGDPATVHSLEEWARTGPSRRLQAASRRPRPTSLAMMARRFVARRNGATKWRAPTTTPAQSGKPDASHPGRCAAGSQRKREPARPRNAHPRVKGRTQRERRSERRCRSAWLSRRFTPSKREPGDSQARERITSSVGVPARRISVADFDCSYLLPFECRKALSCG
jgi:hypothetical protein